jgi:tuftelin-interacting protein 11
MMHENSDSDDSVSPHALDSEDERDDDVDIGFRRPYEKKGTRAKRQEEAIYGVFYESEGDERRASQAKLNAAAPMFVAAKKEETGVSFVKASHENNDDDDAEDATAEKAPPTPPSQQQEEEKQADEYFLNLLNKARQTGNRKRRANTEVSQAVVAESTMPMMGTASLGTITTPTKKDPSLARWEKHTKGIGSKLLQKMGWKGQGGLGTKRRKQAATTTTPIAAKGISRPVEVVVRPANLGLGFGNFKEATQLKSNQQIEAQVRGIDIEKEKKRKYSEDEDFVASASNPNHASSAIPSTNDLLLQQSWKKRARNKKPQVIPYQQLLERQLQQQQRSGGQVIIDMRGPNFGKNDNETSTKTLQGPPPLGEELLYNVSFLLNTYENKLHSSATFSRSTDAKVASMDSNIAEMEERYRLGQERMQKMNKAVEIVHQIKSITAHGSGVNAQNVREQVEALVLQMEQQFTEKDKQDLQFWTVLAPTLLTPAMEASLERWKVLDTSNEGKTASVKIIDSFFEWSLTGDEIGNPNNPDMRNLTESLVCNILVPKIKQVLESTKWNPIQQSESALDVYEYLRQKCLVFGKLGEQRVSRLMTREQVDDNHVLPMNIDDDISPTHQFDLAEAVHKELILDTVHPKLQTAVSSWKPTVASMPYLARTGEAIVNDPPVREPLDAWILPWLPHLDSPALLPNLLSDCKRKVKSTLSFLQRHLKDDWEYANACLNVLKPWHNVFDSKSLQRMMGDNNITARLVRFLSCEWHVESGPKYQCWDSINLLLEFHARRFITDIEFLSILEAEVLTKWAWTKCGDLALVSGSERNEGGTWQQQLFYVVANYCKWKAYCFVNAGGDSKTTLAMDRTLSVVRKDQMICRIFYSVATMIQVSSTDYSSTNVAAIEELQPMESTYQKVLARRSMEERQRVQDDYVKMDARSASETTARIRLQRRQRNSEPTFQEVVEELARERDIVFQPRMGSNSTKDGKQVFLFGSLPLYLDGDVVFCLMEAKWKPVSLDRLVEMAAAGSNN